MKRAARAAAVVTVLLLSGCSTEDEPSPAVSSLPPAAYAPGAAGIGDPYFPTYGNGGYDVQNYGLDLRYDPADGRLSGSATVSATATQDLSTFNLDLYELTVSKVTVDGRPATHRQDGAELIVTPAAGVRTGSAFTAVIEYGGVPGLLENEALGAGGWMRTDDGGFALGQPESASAWFPVNDHPADKATFALAMTVPDGVEAISNGVPGERSTADGWTTWRWTESAPMAPYLSTVVIGQYRVQDTTYGGKPMVIAIPESLAANGPEAESLARTGEIAEWLKQFFGPYPFDAFGGVVLDDDRIGYALETQSRPVYGDIFFAGGENTGVVVHELAHQWLGDSVAIARWQDIWLNEGFATYAEWLWEEDEGGRSVQEIFDATYGGFDWAVPPGDPGAKELFSAAVYQRGAMTLHALRTEIGDDAFFGLLRSWATDHRNGNVTTDDFIAAATAAAGGKDLKPLFEAWLFGNEAP